MINRAVLELHQVWIYLMAILGGLALGNAMPLPAGLIESLLWPALAMLLYVTFTQVPLLHIRDALSDRRFLLAAIAGNFVLLPWIVWFMLQFLPPDPALRLGVLLVLLVPCTDWFVTFTQMAGGNTARAIAVTPVNLLLQIVLMPLYVWLMIPAAELSLAINMDALLPAAMLILALPLVAAVATQYWVQAQPRRHIWHQRLGDLPVPMLALVLAIVACQQASTVMQAGALLIMLLPIFTAFLLIAVLMAKIISVALQLPRSSGITLVYSLSTRNSFMVLPFALALPAGWETTSVVIVFQSLTELFGMLILLRWLPKTLFKPPEQPAPPQCTSSPTNR